VPGPSLQDGIDQAGSPIKLLWKQNPEPWVPPRVAPEYVGWRAEQAAWVDAVALMDLSYHMWDTFIEGPDALRLLRDVSANNFENFAINQAKQFVPVTENGHIISDGILLRIAEDRFSLTGRPSAQTWVTWHAQQGGYDVNLRSDKDVRDPNGSPELFRYQVQGPLAAQLIETAFGGPIPETRFFHSSLVSLGGVSFRALRHGMAGQPGFEFIGDYKDAPVVKAALEKAGEPLGLVHVGALAYPTAQTESGWIPAPTPGIYSDPRHLEYRKWLSLFTPDGQQPLHGSFFSENIEDYYLNPYELDYGRSISFNHDFIGRDALEAAKKETRTHKVTLVLDPTEVRELLGEDHDIVITRARQRVERDAELIGKTHFSSYNEPIGTLLSLAVIDEAHMEPGTDVTVVWGDHAGPGTSPDADLGFPRLNAKVAPAPYNQYARTGYRDKK
jgi:vanillate/3-O-methylgallate O-demethylase